MDSTREPLAGNRTPERWNIVPIPERVALRAYTNVEKTPAGCWVSRYSTASHGYAQIGWQDRARRWVVLAHRASWVHVNGQVPLGTTIDHLCKNRPCVNPDHLRLLPNRENARRINGQDWPMGGCRRGHSNEELVHIKRKTKSGDSRLGMTCGECVRISQRKYNWRHRHPGQKLPGWLDI